MMKPENDFVEYENDLGEINREARNDPASFVENSEKAFHKNIMDIALRIKNEKERCKLVMLAGPSSSGKTTSAHLLSDALKKIGVGSVIISLDDFYLGEYRAPVLPNGQHNYECIEALNVEELKKCLRDLVETNRCSMPVFDFEIRAPYPHKRHITLKDGDIAIVEGIHALNPVLFDGLPSLKVHKAYISVKQGIADGEEQLFGPNDIRLVRRIVRDYNFRGTKPERTLGMWDNVMDGEYKNIKPYRKNADFTINSFHAYELCVLKRQATQLLRSAQRDSRFCSVASKLLDGVGRFYGIDERIVPQNSIIREFIGG